MLAYSGSACARLKEDQLGRHDAPYFLNRWPHLRGVASHADPAWLPRRPSGTLTLTPIAPTPSTLLSSMAAAQDVEHRKMSPNSCVDGL